MSRGRSCSGMVDHRSRTASKRTAPALMAWLLSTTRLRKLGRYEYWMETIAVSPACSCSRARAALGSIQPDPPGTHTAMTLRSKPTRALQLADGDGRSFLDRGGRPHADEDPDRIANLGIGPVIGEKLVAARDACGEVATPEAHRLPRDERCGTSRHGRERRLIDARVGPLVQRLVDDVRGHDEPAHRHLAANQAEEGGREHERGRLPQPGRKAPPNAAVRDPKPRPDRGADPDQDDGDDDREQAPSAGPPTRPDGTSRSGRGPRPARSPKRAHRRHRPRGPRPRAPTGVSGEAPPGRRAARRAIRSAVAPIP